MYVVATTVTNINTILGISVYNPLHFKFFPVRCYHGKISKPPLLCFTTQDMGRLGSIFHFKIRLPLTCQQWTVEVLPDLWEKERGKEIRIEQR